MTGFREVVVNNDDSISIRMTKAKFNEMSREIREGQGRVFEDIKSEYSEYVAEIFTDKGFVEIMADVEPDGAEAKNKALAFDLGMTALVYQTVQNDVHGTIIMIRDEATKETILLIEFPAK